MRTGNFVDFVMRWLKLHYYMTKNSNFGLYFIVENLSLVPSVTRNDLHDVERDVKHQIIRSKLYMNSLLNAQEHSPCIIVIKFLL